MSEQAISKNASAGLDWSPGHNLWLIALTVTLATFMEVLDTSVANVALPHIAGGLAAGQDESSWVLTSYLVSNAIVLPLSGWLSSIFGRKRFYMTCVVLFTFTRLEGIPRSTPIIHALIFGAGVVTIRALAHIAARDPRKATQQRLSTSEHVWTTV